MTKKMLYLVFIVSWSFVFLLLWGLSIRFLLAGYPIVYVVYCVYLLCLILSYYVVRNSIRSKS